VTSADQPDRWIELAGRVGLATQGVLYAVVGVLALQIAAGHTDDRADQRGAIEKVSEQPVGRWLLLVLTFGLALHCLWRLFRAIRGTPGADEDTKSVLQRVAQLGRAVVYGGFAYVAIRILVDAGRADGGTTQKAASKALDLPGGSVVLFVVGVVIAAAGVWHARKAVTRSFTDDLDLAGKPEVTRDAAVAAGVVGFAGRGLVYMVVGWFLVHAATQHDPNQSGVDQSLKRLAAAGYGPQLLRALAVGLFMFGVFRVLDGLLRRRRALEYA
jgi:hypothetical protein